MALYKEQKREKLTKEQFQNPTSEYRGAPFWAWNNKLDRDQLLRQIDYFKEMGMGGFHIHCREGLDTPYMGKEYQSIVAACCQKAKQEGLLCWLYDEDRWPSGTAGGMVTKNSEYCQRRLIFTAFEHPSEEFVKGDSLTYGVLYHMAEYAVMVQDGILQAYERIVPGEIIPTPARRWYAYLTIAPRNDSFNGESYVDTLNKRAIETFIEKTHQEYYRTLGSEFGQTVPAIFTDEPQFASKQTLTRCDEPQEIQIPFTDDLEEAYQEAYEESLLDKLPELFWELPEGVSVTRYRFHNFVAERFAESFADTIGQWCEAHGIMLTGHMMAEDTLVSQTSVLGDAMRSYRSFQLPGIDILMDRREFATAKQAQSASHQYGREGVLSELYGVTNWDFDFRGHKLQGDWQAALGVTTRVPHLTWVSMKGEAKRDYPASIGYQSPWYQQYSLVEDHFARVNTALTRGKARVRVGVIHPVESVWLYYGSNEKTGAIRGELQENFQNLLQWMLFGLIDFDYICESLLPSQCSVKETDVLQVGQMQYEAIVVPGCVTLRSSTLESLEAFARGGGHVIFVGEPAPYMDAQPSNRAVALAAQCKTIPFSKKRVLDALEPFRDLDIISINGLYSEWGGKGAGARTERLLYQMRQDGEDRWLFIAHGLPMLNPDIPYGEVIEIQLAGEWKPTLYHTISGTITPLPAQYQDGKTLLTCEFYEHDSLLFLLEPGTRAIAPTSEASRPEEGEIVEFPDILPITKSAPNVLLLDMAEFKIDRGPWKPREEILRIDKKVREALHIRRSRVQPWTIQKTGNARHMVHLRYTIECQYPARNLTLALENQEETRIFLDDCEIQKKVQGYFTDEAIETVALPDLGEGIHHLELELPYSEETYLEACYVIGEFGVRVIGSQALIVEPVQQLEFGSWTEQGLPFYGQNITYHIPIKLEKAGTLRVQATKFRCPLWKVYLDGDEKAAVAFAPYMAEIPDVAAGQHEVAIEVFGNQINTFGCVHNCNEQLRWFGSGAWKTEGASWAYEYQLKRCGILKKPEIRLFENKERG